MFRKFTKISTQGTQVYETDIVVNENNIKYVEAYSKNKVKLWFSTETKDYIYVAGDYNDILMLLGVR